MDQNRILISENIDLFKTIDSELDSYVDALNEAIEKYPPLELGEATSEEAQLLLSPLGGKTIETRYWDTLKAQLDKSGVTNKILRDTVLNGSQEPIQQFKAAHRKVQALPITYRDTMKHIVFDGSNFGLIKGYKEEILEKYCREYLTDKSETAFLETVKNLVKAISQYRAELKKVEAGFYLTRSLRPLEIPLRIDKNDNWIVDVEGAINYHRNAKRNMTAGSSTKRIF